MFICYIIFKFKKFKNRTVKRWGTLVVKDLVQKFIKEKNYTPSDVNDLLDYLGKCYISDELSIVEYKKLFSELNKNNAEKPSEFFIKTKLFNLDFELPC
jgi:hypothetical protein